MMPSHGEMRLFYKEDGIIGMHENIAAEITGALLLIFWRPICNDCFLINSVNTFRFHSMTHTAGGQLLKSQMTQ